MSEAVQPTELKGMGPVPCLKTLSLKILTSHWVTEYSAMQKLSALTPEKFPLTLPKVDMSRCLARKQVAEEVQTLIKNRVNCGDDIFLPLLALRCQKEIAKAQEKKESDRDYYEASAAAWEHVLTLATK